MKRVIFILILAWISYSLTGMVPDQELQSSKQLKRILDDLSGSIVKVVAESGKVYVGTGIALDRDLVLTSALVTRKPDARLVVIRMDERRFPARLKGSDPRTSVALLELESPVLTPIPMASKVEVGDGVALVSAFYDQFPAVQRGVVSSVSSDAVILNAAAVPGSSGGAVLDQSGRLVAVVRGRFGYGTSPDIHVEDESGGVTILGRKFRSGDLSYAVSVNRVREISDKLRRYGHVPRGWAGVHLVVAGENRALLVSGIQSGSPAQKADLRMNDRILAVNGTDVKTVADVAEAIKDLAPGETVRLDVQRKHVRKGILITLAQAPDATARPQAPVSWIDGSSIDESAGNLPLFRSYVFQAGKDAPLILEDFRRRMRQAAVSIHHRSLEPLHGELRRLAWETGLLEKKVEGVTSVRLERLKSHLKSLKKRTREALEIRERQLEEDRRNMERDLEQVRRRLESLEKKPPKS